MLKVEEDTRRRARISVVDQYRAPTEEVAVAFERDVERGAEQRMPRMDKRGKRLTRRVDKRLLEGDPLVPRQNWFAESDRSIAIPDRRRNMGDFVASALALLHRSAKPLERLEEEGLYVMRLEASCFGALHLLADVHDSTRVHRVVDEDLLVEEVANLARVEGVLDHLGQASADVGLITISNGLEEQIPKGSTVKLHLAEDIEDLATERVPSFLQLDQKRLIDVALAGLLSDQVPQVTDLCLTDAMDPAEALFDPVGVPRQVVGRADG
jgi:hypothetical protein